MIRKNCNIRLSSASASAIVTFIFILFLSTSCSGDNPRLSVIIDSMTTLLEDAPRSMDKEFRQIAQSESKTVLNALLPKLNDASSDSAKFVKIMLMLVQTGDTVLVDTILAIANGTSSEYIRFNCMWALSQLGTERAGKFILSDLSSTTDPDTRYAYLTFLAGMHYADALAETEEVLLLDLENSYWMQVLLFGRFGEVAVPFLLEHLDHNNAQVRQSAAYLLGKWLMPTEAASHFKSRFWQETDRYVKSLIIGTIVDLEANFDSVDAFYKEIVRREPEWDTTMLMISEREYLKDLKKELRDFRKNKRVSTEAFNHEYDLLVKSSGLEGSYEILETASSLADEPDLLKLRTEIFSRRSDEAMTDYNTVTRVIILNRMLAAK